MGFWDVRKSFQILPFYNALIEKPKIKLYQIQNYYMSVHFMMN